MRSEATTVEEYLKSLPEDRRQAIKAVRAVILKNLPAGFEEGMQYGMIGYYVPHTIYPSGYHCDPRQPLPFASLASQKNYMAIYLMCLYSDEQGLKDFEEGWKKTGKKLDMGKSCVRFKRLEDVPLNVIGQTIRRVPVKKFIAHYEAATKTAKSQRAVAKTSSPSKQAAKKTGRQAPRKKK